MVVAVSMSQEGCSPMASEDRSLFEPRVWRIGDWVGVALGVLLLAALLALWISPGLIGGWLTSIGDAFRPEAALTQRFNVLLVLSVVAAVLFAFCVGLLWRAVERRGAHRIAVGEDSGWMLPTLLVVSGLVYCCLVGWVMQRAVFRDALELTVQTEWWPVKVITTMLGSIGFGIVLGVACGALVLIARLVLHRQRVRQRDRLLGRPAS